MTTQSAYAAFGADIDASTGAPDWVHLVPAGPEILARDGRRFRLSDPHPVLDAFAACRGMLPIDWEHANDDKARRSERRPAAGWIKDLDVRADWTRAPQPRMRRRQSGRSRRPPPSIRQPSSRGPMTRPPAAPETWNRNAKGAGVEGRGSGRSGPRRFRGSPHDTRG